MSEYVTLIGTESVERAGRAMQEAADRMERAAASMQDVIDSQRRMLDEALSRFAMILEEDHRRRIQ